MHDYYCENCEYKGSKLAKNEEGNDVCPECGSGNWEDYERVEHIKNIEGKISKLQKNISKCREHEKRNNGQKNRKGNTGKWQHTDNL